MPNHVTHRVRVTGPKDEIERFTEKCISAADERGRRQFDFNTLIPMPEEIDKSDTRITSAGGFPRWYTWSIEHWGTKWNSYSFEWIDEGAEPVFKFDTAWSTPGPIWDALAKEFPTLAFHVTGFDEGWNFAVSGIIEDGVSGVEETRATDELYEAAYGEPPQKGDEEDEA